MPRRLDLENLPGDGCLSNTLIFMQLRTLSRHGAHSTPLLSVTCALFSVQWRGRGPRPLLQIATSQQSRVTKPFRMRTYKQTPRFARFWPKLSFRNSFRMRTCKNSACNSFRMRTYQKRLREGTQSLSFYFASSRLCFMRLQDTGRWPPHRLASFFSSTYNLGIRTKYFSP
jgi:hypothetical protein